MEGFRYFPDTTTSLRIPQSPLPEPYARSSVHYPVGESHFDKTLEAAFSLLNVSDGNGSALKYPSNCHGLGGDDFLPFSYLPRNDESQSLNGVLWHMGLQDCWVDSNPDGSDGFLSNLYKPLNCLSVADLRGRIASLAKDQNGCRFLQKAMEVMPNEKSIDIIFLEVIEHVALLMLDPYGNYVIQKLVEVCSEEQRTQILLTLTKNDFQLVSICLDTRGTRSVQKLLKHVTTKQQISLIMRALSPGAVALSKNSNGQHVIEHCLKNFSVEDNKYLLNVVADNCFGIAKDKSGCCVLQQCVEYSQGETRDRLVAEIIAKALVLSVDRYGNYVVQHLLGLRIPQITANLQRQLEGSYMSLSCNKYGSNVVEKCLLESGEEQSMQIILELLKSPSIPMLLLHPFGNYVIQTALSVSKAWISSKLQWIGFDFSFIAQEQFSIHQILLSLVKKHSPIMRNNYYGKKVLDWRNRNLQH